MSANEGPYQAHFELLKATALRSGCLKSQHGAIIVDPDGELQSVGYNSPVIGRCDGSDACRRDCAQICTHAGEAAILSALTPQSCELCLLHVVGGVAVPSREPRCVVCSGLALRSGVSGVWLLLADGWRRWTAEEFHRETLRNLGLHGATT